MIEKKVKNKTLLYLGISFVVLVFSLLFMAFSPISSVYASASSSSDVREQYSAIKSQTIYENSEQSKDYMDASAHNDTKLYNSSDDIYSFGNGSNIFYHSMEKLIFRLELTNANHETIDNTAVYKFDLYRCADDGVTATNTISLMFIHYYNESDNHTYMVGGIRRNVFTTETIGLSGYGRNAYDDTNISEETLNAFYGVQAVRDSGYELIYFNGSYDANSQLQMFTASDNRQFIYLTIEPIDKFTRYFVRFSYDFNKTQTFLGVGWSEKTIKNKIDSNIVSIYDVVNNMYLRGHLGVLSTRIQAQAKQLLDIGEVKEIQVSYLEQIGNTPFATKKYAYVNVPVKSGIVEPSDVANQLGLENLNVLQTSCMYFKQDPYTKVYNAYYLKNVWLSSKDANGHSVNMFLDINVSYYEYYHGLLEDGIMTNGMYEWLWNSMLTSYTELTEYDDTELYGYFGYAVIPDVSSINSLWNDLFDGGKSFDGVVKHFEYKQANLSMSAYNKLLTEYGYNWLSKAWNHFMSWFKDDGACANHYFFYVDGLKDNSFIGENGADNINDNGGAVQNGVQDAVEDVVDTVEGLFENDWVKYIVAVLGLVVGVLLITFVLKSIFSVKTAYNQSKGTRKRR